MDNNAIFLLPSTLQALYLTTSPYTPFIGGCKPVRQYPEVFVLGRLADEQNATT